MKRILALITAVLMLIGCTAAEAAASYRTEINKEQNTVRFIFTDETGNPTEGPDGCEILELEYQGKVKWPNKIRYLDAEGNRKMNHDGYAVIKFEYNGKRTAVTIDAIGI